MSCSKFAVQKKVEGSSNFASELCILKNALKAHKKCLVNFILYLKIYNACGADRRRSQKFFLNLTNFPKFQVKFFAFLTSLYALCAQSTAQSAQSQQHRIFHTYLLVCNVFLLFQNYRIFRQKVTFRPTPPSPS